jgi:hypothetical protein
MNRIFSPMRRVLLAEGRVGAYLRYAAGEILLVVIGILIALQINNWNEERIEQRNVRAYAHALADDLGRDLQMLVPIDGQIRTLLRQIDEFADYARGRPLTDIANSELFLYTYDWAYRPYAWNRSALERLKTSGALQTMRNPELIDKIAAYDALTRHLDQDFIDDRDMIRTARAHSDRVRNGNYPQLAEARAYFAQMPDDDTERAFFAFRDTDTFRAMQALNLPPLANNIGDVEVMVNAMLGIRSGLSPRVDTELPRLRRMSEEIAALIASEYP